MKHPKYFILSSVILTILISGQEAEATTLVTESISADEQTAAKDSTATDLQEVVVEGRTQRVIKFGVEYIPGKNQKKHATDATDLIRRMMIPSLRVSPDESVTAANGDGVSMFIDFVPASPNELSGLLPEDVLRVEVLEFPDDPRFNGAKHVINFIMRKYEWGGYTKLTANGTFVSQLQGNGRLYSKYSRGRWTFDLSGYGTGSRITGYWTNSTVTMRDLYYEGKHYDVLQQNAYADKDKVSKSDYESASFRAAYRTDSLYIEHKLSFSRNWSDADGGYYSEYTGNILPPTTSVSHGNRLSNSPGISGYYQFILPRRNTITASWGFSYGRNKKNSSYWYGKDQPILNSNKEDVYSPSVSVSYNKGLRHNNSIGVSLSTNNTVYKTGYDGSYEGIQKMLSSENSLSLQYMQNWAFGLNIFAKASGSYVLGRVNGVNTLKEFNPSLQLDVQYQFNEKHSLSLSNNIDRFKPTASTSNTAIVRNSEFMWIQGNPDLKSQTYHFLNLGYMFVPCNWFNLYASIGYRGNPNKEAMDVYSLPGYDGLIMRRVNSGSGHVYTGFLSGTFSLLNNSLNLNLRGNLERAELTGIGAQKRTMVSGEATASYYLGNFSFFLNYSTPRKYCDGSTMGQYIKSPSQYGLTVSYGIGNFRARLDFSNWFETTNETYSWFDMPRYTMEQRMHSRARSLSIQLSYTFTYGKKINMNNELRDYNGVGSGILN